MIPPSNWDEELRILRRQIKMRLDLASKSIVDEEVFKVLGRVKIITSKTLQNDEYSWFIEPAKKEDDAK